MKDDVEERALIIPVPQAQAFVSSFRARCIGLVDDGIPAHITVNFPFRPAVSCESQLEDILTGIFAGMRAFHLSLREIRRFPTVLCLAPEPEERLRMMITTVADRFPESPPYEGLFEDVIPHLTVAHLEDGQDIDERHDALTTAAAEQLPIMGEVTSVLLIEKIGDEWRDRQSFQLGG